METTKFPHQGSLKNLLYDDDAPLSPLHWLLFIPLLILAPFMLLVLWVASLRKN
jgi:hypothetical protein